MLENQEHYQHGDPSSGFGSAALFSTKSFAPAFEQIHIAELLKNGSVEVHNDEFIPVPEFVAEIASEALTGALKVISWMRTVKGPEGTAQQICADLRSSDLVRFQQNLASALSAELDRLTLPRSVHADQLAAVRSNPEVHAENAVGFTGHCAKVVPIHRDLARYQSEDGGSSLRPAAISLIAWGGRAGIADKTVLQFIDAADTESLHNGNMRLYRSRPELELLSEDAVKLRTEQGMCRAATLPDYALTIFGNSNRAHGATWEQYRAGRAFNRMIDAEKAASADSPVSAARPIHVVLL